MHTTNTPAHANHHARTDRQQRPATRTLRPWGGLSAALKLAALAALLAVLTACGAIIGPQAVVDPFGLDATMVPIQFGAGPAALAPMAVTGSAEGDFEFPDFEQALPLTPKIIDNQVSLAGAELNDPNGPETITLTSATLTVRLWHGADSYDQASTADRVQVQLSAAGALVFTRDTCSASACTYDVGTAALGTISLSGGPLSSFLNVAVNPPTPNQGQASMQVEASNDELAGATLTLELDASQGTIRF